MHMRHFLILAACAASPATVAAAAPWGMAGCGLGSLLFEDDNPQISAATTNGTLLNQGFALSSGTSNCYTPKQAAAVRMQEDFFVANLGTLSKEMARGEGASLVAMGKLFGCNEQASASVGQVVKESYGRIFAAPGAMAVYDETKAVLASDMAIVQQCSFFHAKV